MITLTSEQAQQIEEALVATLKNNDYWLEKCTGALDTIRAARAQEQAEQKPVAWAHPSGGYLSAYYMKEVATGLEKITYTIPLYAAPVRTKDLTDDEIAEAVGSQLDEVYLADFRAVIAADREKNRG